MNIHGQITYSDEKPAVVSIRNNEKINIIAIGLKKGRVLKKHVTKIPATLIVLKGTINFEINGENHVLQPLETFDIPVDVEHEVTGVEECIFTVIKEK